MSETPERIWLVEDDQGVLCWSPEPNPYADTIETAGVEYVRADEHAAEQRQMCADAVIAELKSIGFQIHESGEARIRDACLGATGESDDK